MRLSRVVSSERMRAIEARCFATGLSAMAVMESAGRAVAARALASDPRRVTVVCGKGNNGADGMVAARALHAMGLDVCVCFVSPSRSELGELHARLLALSGVRIGTEIDVARADLVVDAVLGIGARQPLAGAEAQWVELINAQARQVLAVDVPSGVCAAFSAGDLAVRAHATVTFHAHKAELAMLPARAHAGEIFVAEIGIPDALFGNEDGWVCDHAWAKAHFVSGGSGSHKGTFGHVGIYGGAAGMEGAQVLASLAAARTGAGLVSAVVLGESKRLPAQIMKGAADKRYSAACFGPGLGRDHDDALFAWLSRCDVPAVIDADALNALAEHADWPTLLGPGPRVLTPHPLELARLVRTDVTAVQADRINVAMRAARMAKATVVLKGANTVIAAPDGRFAICASGGRELAKGGTGDVLAGMIAALLGMRDSKNDTFTCSGLGAYLHGSAGAHAAATRSKTSVLAQDVIAAIALATRDLE